MQREDYVSPTGARFVEYVPGGRDATPIKLTSTNGQVKVPSATVELMSAASVQALRVRWLWDGWLAQGKLHLLAGSPGTGKTTIALAIAAATTVGSQLPDGAIAEKGDVLIWSGEDGVADTLVPRFLAAGGDPKRLHFVHEVTERGRGRPFDPATDMPKLIAAGRMLPSLKLIVLDPVVAAVTGDSHKNTETRRGLQPVVDMATELDVVVLGITHLSKGTSGREPLERVAGSIAFGAVARIVLATVKPPDPDAPRRLVRAKSNLGPDTGGFEYTLFGAPVPGHDFHAQRVEWGQALEGSARELMAIEQPDDDGGEKEDAEAFLLDILGAGPVPSKEIEEARKAHAKFSPRTLHRAKAALSIIAVKSTTKNGAWTWELPAASKDANSHTEGCHLD